MKKCKRGSIADRDRFGHCLCNLCKAYRYEKSKQNPKRKDYIKQWSKNNKEKIASYVKKWITENKEKRREIEKSWKLRNPEKVKSYNKKAGAKWAKNNKGKRNASKMKRIASLLNQTPVWADKEKIIKIYDECSRITKETGVPHEVDHIIPLQGELVNGLHIHTNLQIITRSKNRSKKNKVEK